MSNTRPEHQEYNEVIHALQVATFCHDTNKHDFSATTYATGLSSSWLSAFVNGRIREAGFFKVRKLQAWLEQQNKERVPTRSVIQQTESGVFGSSYRPAADTAGLLEIGIV